MPRQGLFQAGLPGNSLEEDISTKTCYRVQHLWGKAGGSLGLKSFQQPPQLPIQNSEAGMDLELSSVPMRSQAVLGNPDQSVGSAVPWREGDCNLSPRSILHLGVIPNEG